MELELLLKINEDAKMHEYLYSHSQWYRYLNRNKNNFEAFKKEFKNYKHSNTMNKVNDTIDNIELITNILKIVE